MKLKRILTLLQIDNIFQKGEKISKGQFLIYGEETKNKGEK
jgi:hypothetical protein